LLGAAVAIGGCCAATAGAMLFGTVVSGYGASSAVFAYGAVVGALGDIGDV